MSFKFQVQRFSKNDYLRAKNLPHPNPSSALVPEPSPRSYLVPFTPLPADLQEQENSVEKPKHSGISRNSQQTSLINSDLGKNNLISQIEALESQLRLYREKYLNLESELRTLNQLKEELAKSREEADYLRNRLREEEEKNRKLGLLAGQGNGDKVREVERILENKIRENDGLMKWGRDLEASKRLSDEKLNEKDVLIEKLAREIESSNSFIKNLAADNQFFKSKCQMLEKEVEKYYKLV